MDEWASSQQRQQPQHTPLRPPPTDRPPTTPLPRPPSSESARHRVLTGQLTLHEYRKLQLTPSPPARGGGRTVKRKAALENLAPHLGERTSPNAYSPPCALAPLQLQGKTFQESIDSRLPSTSEAEEFYRSYLHSGKGGNFYNHSIQRPPFTPALTHESEVSTYLSTLNFPEPPANSPPQQQVSTRPPQRPPFYPSNLTTEPAIPTTVVHYRGASFDILNPHRPLDSPQMQTPGHHNRQNMENIHSSATSSHLSANDMSSTSSRAGSANGGRQALPHRALFQDLPTAHSSITARSMKDRSTPSPTQFELSSKLPVMVDLPLPPQPVAIQHHSQNYEASLPSEFVIAMPPQLPEEKMVSSSTWKDKLGSAFTRKLPAVSVLLPTVSEKGPGDSPRAGLVVEPRSSAYLPPFKRTSYTSQSVPHLTADTYQQDHHRISSSAGHLSHHYYDDSSIYHNGSDGAPSGSLVTSSSRSQGSMPYGLDYNEEVDAQSHGYGFYDKNTGRDTGTTPDHSRDACFQAKGDSEATAMSAKVPKRSTVGSIEQKYGDIEAGVTVDFEDIGLDSDDEDSADTQGKASRADKRKFYTNPGLQLLQLGKNILGTNVGILDPKKGGTGKENTRLTSSSPPSLPPNVPLPPGPPANYRSSSNNRSTFTRGLSHHNVSYGDTRNLLDISQDLSRGGMANQSSGALTSVSAQASSCALGYFGDADLNAADARTSAVTSAAGQLGIKQNLTYPTIERVRSESNSPRSLPGSFPSSDKALESDIYSELRRQSGLSNLSGNVFILSNDEIRVAQFNPDTEDRISIGDLGPGGSRTSSSRGQMSRDLSNLSGSSDAAKSFHDGLYGNMQITRLGMGKERVNITDKGSYASSFQGTNYSETISEPDPPDGFEDDNDGDWETVAESGALSRYGTGRLDADENTAHALADDSVGGFSSYGSLGVGHFKNNPFGPTRQVVKHPADPRFEHVYRLRKITPDGQTILLPTYNFSGGVGFPNRNAMTPPLPVTLPFSRYQHPTPLSPEHIHPFNSSPPEIPRKAPSRAYDCLHNASDSAQGNDKRSLVDHEPHHKHRHNTYSSSIRQYSSMGSEIVGGSTENLNQKPGNSFGEVGMDGTYASSAWMNNFGEPGPVLDSQDLPGANGSFAKVTVLGLRANVTGTPDGTGMREVGSSLAGDSSHAHWSSSPHQQGSSPTSHLKPLSKPPSPTLPEPTYPSQKLREQNVHRQQGYYNKQIRQHLEERKAMGLTEPVFYPASPFHNNHMHTNSDGRLSPIDSISMSSLRALCPDRPVSYNTTPPLPHLWTAKQRQMIIDERRENNHHHRPRKGSFDSTDSYRRQRTISRAILIFCMLFPIVGWMMLLLFGYGCMDATVAYCTNGEILKLRRREKSIALVFSWVVIVVGILGLIVASAVVTTKYH
ncbi:hypothetical protein FGG08_003424 [Glutinoglossum americanum]|uniref:Uncharacterized protein n=1 Tax=Glutinoglossum americanum TaxID=1670608 RepID=A0A9P8L0L8_9PEZI|nr:hypothetical protein FGG08_003424 [Glutinoglossum americanum]